MVPAIRRILRRKGREVGAVSLPGVSLRGQHVGKYDAMRTTEDPGQVARAGTPAT